MGFWSQLLAPPEPKAIEASQVDATAIAPYFSDPNNIFFGGVLTATREEAMSVPTIARALSIFQTMASLPMNTREIKTGVKVDQPRVINQPDTRISGTTFWAWIISDLFFHPSAYAYVVDRYKDTGRIREMERIAPERVQIRTNNIQTEIVEYLIDNQPIDPSNLVVFAGAQEGLLSRAGRTIRAAAALEKSALDFALDPIPQMVLQSNGTSLPPDRVSKLLQALRNRVRKSAIFLNADVKLDTIGHDPRNLQLNEARSYVSLELSRACGLPAYFTDSQQSSFTYANALDKRRDLVDFAFRIYMSVIEKRLSFPDFTSAGKEVSFDLDDFLRGNPYERAQVYEILNRIVDENGNPAMSVEKIQEEEDMLL
ncbi:portal_HK97, phage portal protein, HK97 family [uncultured Caudovirales phage]|uniref:Portal_HK97, phage portal protein, HK97 family n=1 Tax=uncultured Caudovirales phage TaxID=2100421 RepID=A0A6J5T2F5_9CAUD|nr:portal_HK97, phage portal protein, HK97 family [uncultured Caudovirales phage]CAB4221972.1 portal_HK97, phage portal protein, HK97 family [uncultured Caudovirales phage]